MYKSARRARVFLPIIVTSLLVCQFSNLTFAAPEVRARHNAQRLPDGSQGQSQVETYDQLVHAIREVRVASELRMEQEKVRVAWETGKLIDAHVFQYKKRADYDKRVIPRLARDLGSSERELRYMLEFARAYPIQPTSAELTWSDYRELLALNDPEQRKQIAEQAEKEKWDVKQIRQRVLRINASAKGNLDPEALEVLEAKPGKLHIYRVVKAAHGPYQGQLALDLGFSNYLSLRTFFPKRRPQDGREAGRGVTEFKEKDLVILEKGKLKLFKGSSEDRYTYRAYVSQIIDGDTFKAVIDLGFEFVTEQKLRLRGLDAPEIESAEGREAKAFLEEQITKAGGTVVIKTVKSDKYDRYLADVFAGGSYLNQELLDRDLAVRVSE